MSTDANTGESYLTPNQYPTSQPSHRYRQSTIRDSLLRGGITIDSGGNDDLGRDGHDSNEDLGRHGHDTFGFGLNGRLYPRSPTILNPIYIG